MSNSSKRASIRRCERLIRLGKVVQHLSAPHRGLPFASSHFGGENGPVPVLGTTVSQSLLLFWMPYSTTPNTKSTKNRTQPTADNMSAVAHMRAFCSSADKHDALHLSLLRVLSKLHVPDTDTLLTSIIGTEAFLRPWTEYRDGYLLNPRFNDEGLCAGADRLDQLYEHIKREVREQSTALPPLDDSSEGESYTIRLYSSLARGLSGSCPSGEVRDPKWPKRLCKDLYMLVKHLRAEYVHGHGALVDVIETRHLSRWLQGSVAAQDSISPIEEDEGLFVTPSPADDSSIVAARAEPGRVGSVYLVRSNAEQRASKEDSDEVDIKLELHGDDHMPPNAYSHGFTPLVSSSSEEAGESDGKEGVEFLKRWKKLSGAYARDGSLSSTRPSKWTSPRLPLGLSPKAQKLLAVSDGDVMEISRMFSLGSGDRRRKTSTPTRSKSRKHGLPDTQSETPSRSNRQFPSASKQEQKAGAPEAIRGAGSQSRPFRGLVKNLSSAPQTTFTSSPPTQSGVLEKRRELRAIDGFRVPFLLSDSDSNASSVSESRALCRRNAAAGGRHRSSRTSIAPASISTGSLKRAARLGRTTSSSASAICRTRSLEERGEGRQPLSRTSANGSQVSTPTKLSAQIPLFPPSPQGYSLLPEDDHDAALMSITSHPSSPETMARGASKPEHTNNLRDLLSSVKKGNISSPFARPRAGELTR